MSVSDKNGWRWTSEINFWRNTAKVTGLDVPAFNTGAFGASLGTYRIQQGKSPIIAGSICNVTID